jgi:predicted nucleic acid-binding protein
MLGNRCGGPGDRPAHPALAAKRGLDAALMFAALAVMPVAWRAQSEYEDRRHEAEERIAARDPDDWPTVALALHLNLPIWSQDKDLIVTLCTSYTGL